MLEYPHEPDAAALLEQAGAYAHLFDRVSAGGRSDAVSSEGPIRLSTRTASAASLVAQVSGVPRAQAGTMVASGVAFRTREALTGEPLPAVHPFIAAAFADGLLDPDVAAAMRRALDKAAPGLAPWEQDALERQVVAFSQEGWTADELIAWLKQLREHANPEAGKPSPDEPAPVETVTRKARANGQFQWVLNLDAVTDAFLKTRLRRPAVLVRRRAPPTRRLRPNLAGQRRPALLAMPPPPRSARLAARTHRRTVVVDTTTLDRPHRTQTPRRTHPTHRPRQLTPTLAMVLRPRAAQHSNRALCEARTYVFAQRRHRRC